MYLSIRNSSPKRRGVILLIVLMMLVLFAIVGITFVLMADVRSTESRIFREAQSVNLNNPPEVTDPPGPNVPLPANGASTVPDLQLAYWLNRFIYDDADDAVGVCDDMRGWSVAR